MTGDEKTKTHHLLGLDLLRFFAAMSVMFYHLAFLIWASPENPLRAMLKTPEPAAYPIGWNVTWFGWIGVDIFFVLSGFVIAYSAEKSSACDFLIRRITRLAPAMWVCAAITTLMVLATGIEQPLHALQLYLKSISFFPIGPWSDGVYWTLGVEINFYAVIFLLLCFGKFKWLHNLASILAMACMAFWLGHFFLDDNRFFAATGSMQRFTQLLLLQDGGYFALGIELWLCWKQGIDGKKLIIIALSLIAGILRIIAKYSIEIKAQNLSYGPALSALVPICAWLLALAIIVACIRWNKKIAAILSPVEIQIRLLGLATYPLYLIHDRAGGALVVTLKNMGLLRSISIFLGIASVITVSLLITALIEPRIRQPLRKALMQCRDTYLKASWKMKLDDRFRGHDAELK